MEIELEELLKYEEVRLSSNYPLSILADNFLPIKSIVDWRILYPFAREPHCISASFVQLIISVISTFDNLNSDKAPVENFVKITYRRVYAHLRNHTFHNLAELNRAIKEKLTLHHQMNFQKKTFSRLELFTGQEAQHLQPLPESPYQIRHYTKAKVQKNYHVVIGEDWHFYSVPIHRQRSPDRVLRRYC